MDIKELRYFVQISYDKSFSSASKNLFITQQALSKSVKNMEIELGVKLFERKTVGVELTPNGEYLLEKAEDILLKYHQIISEVNAHFKVKKRLLKIGIIPGFLPALSPFLLREFHQKHSDIVLEWKEIQDLKCEELVNEGALDVGCTSPPDDLVELEFIPVKSEPLFLFVNLDHPLAQKEGVAIQDLKGEKLILCGDDCRLHHQVVAGCKSAGFEPNIIFTTWEMALLMPLISKGEGVTVFPLSVIESLMTQQVSAIPFIEEAMIWEIGLLIKKKQKSVTEIKQFVDFVVSGYYR